MAQQPHFVIPDDGSAGDISAGLPAGCYVGQLRLWGAPGAFEAYYATAEAAPASLADYFVVKMDGAFEFFAGPSTPPTWVRMFPAPERSSAHNRATVAIARVGTENAA